MSKTTVPAARVKRVAPKHVSQSDKDAINKRAKRIVPIAAIPAHDAAPVQTDTVLLPEYPDRAERDVYATRRVVLRYNAYVSGLLGFPVHIALNGARIADGFAMTAEPIGASGVTYKLDDAQNATLDVLRANGTDAHIISDVKRGFESANANNADKLAAAENVARQARVNAQYASLRDAVGVMLAYEKALHATAMIGHYGSIAEANGAPLVQLAAYIADLCGEVQTGVRAFSKTDDARAKTARDVYAATGDAS